MVMNIYISLYNQCNYQPSSTICCVFHHYANESKCVNFNAFYTGKCDLNAVNDYEFKRLKGYIRNARGKKYVG